MHVDDRRNLVYIQRNRENADRDGDRFVSKKTDAAATEDQRCESTADAVPAETDRCFLNVNAH